MPHSPRPFEIAALKTQAGEHAIRTERFGQYLDVAHAVLQGQAEAVRFQDFARSGSSIHRRIGVHANQNCIRFGKAFWRRGSLRTNREVSGQAGQ